MKALYRIQPEPFRYNGYLAKPGSGPRGQTCKICLFTQKSGSKCELSGMEVL